MRNLEEALLLQNREERIREVMTWGLFIGELKKASSVAVPLVTVAVLQYLLQVVSLMVAGHLGELALSGVAIATSFCNVTGFSLLMGFASALETLCGQAYGAKQYEKVGAYTYSAIISILPICVPICIVWIFMDKLLVLMGQEAQVAMVACRYALWLLPALVAYAVLQSQIRFLLSQSLILPMLYVSIATLVLHVPLCWIMVFKSGLGYNGAALAIGFSYWLCVILIGLYIKYSPSCEKTRVLDLKEAFLNVKEFLRFGIPSAGMVCLEWWSFEILVLLSGLLPNPTLATSVISVCFTTNSLHYYIPYGISAAASTRVSNELGAAKPQAAQIASLVVMGIALVESVIAATILFFCRGILGYAFSDDIAVIANVADLIPLTCLSVIMDSLHSVLAGIVRGIGWQNIGAYATLGSYYLGGVPVGVLCGFVLRWGVKGLWLGMLTGSIIEGILLALVAVFTNWEKQAIVARERVFDREGTITEDETI